MHTVDTIIVGQSTGRDTYSSFPTPDNETYGQRYTGSATVVDMIPLGWSAIADPAFTFTEWDTGRHAPTPWQGSYISGEDELFYAYAHGGYAMQYVSDGDIHCSACALAHWQETGERWQPWASTGDYSESTGIHCGTCEAEIVAPHCLECGNENYSGPYFTSDSGEYQICGHCLAEYVVRGDAVKVDLNTYDGNANVIHAWRWQGQHPTSEQLTILRGYANA